VGASFSPAYLRWSKTSFLVTQLKELNQFVKIGIFTIGQEILKCQILAAYRRFSLAL
jgi:hypothetical protein